MANHKSAIKRARQNDKRRTRNRAVKTRLKNVVKDVAAAVTDGTADKTAENLKTAQSAIDKAAKKGVIHRRTAARKISRLARKVKTSAAS